MNVSLPPAEERYIKTKIKKGLFKNPAEVVRKALCLMREQESGRPPSRLMNAVQKGLDDVKAGRVKTYPSVKAFMKKIESDNARKIKSGEPFKYDPDVIGPGDDGPWGGNLS